jgi:CheY-like chemotaxis protein
MRGELGEIVKAGGRAANLTRQLLAFSRQQVVEPRVIDLNELIKSMDTMLGRLVGEDVRLVLNLGQELGRVKADVGHLEQVIMNLVINARDAMPDGGTLIIETSDVMLDDAYARDHLDANVGPHVMLAVSDTGSGMDEATRLRIFEPFFTTKERGRGTGLGLSTVYGFVKQNGGSIWVGSGRGKGTTFRVFLPCASEDAASAGHRAVPLVHRAGTETILLVEDDDQVRAVALNILRSGGYQVLEAPNPDDALTLSQAHAGTIHLLLTDVVMPGINGRELAERLQLSRPDMEVLFMSGYTDNVIAQHNLIDADSDLALLQKPFTPDVLLRRVRQSLESRAS